MTTWHHSRKGRIVGTLLWVRGEWACIRLQGDHQLRWGSPGRKGTVTPDGTALQVRTSLIREVTP